MPILPAKAERTPPRTDAELEQLLGDPEPIAGSEVIASVPGRYTVTELNRDKFLELAQRSQSGDVRMVGMESGTCFGINRSWLWRVTWEKIMPEEKVLVQASLL